MIAWTRHFFSPSYRNCRMRAISGETLAMPDLYSFSHCLTKMLMDAAARLQMRLENHRALIASAEVADRVGVESTSCCAA